MPARRLEDRVGRVVLVPCPPGLPTGAKIGGTIAHARLELRPFSLERGAADLGTLPAASRPDPLHAILAINLHGDDLLLVTGGEIVRLPQAGGGEALPRRLAAAAADARSAYARALRRNASRDAFLLLSERLTRARCADDVGDALVEQMPLVVEGFAALLAMRAPDAAESGPLVWRSALAGPGARVDPSLPPLPPLTAEAASLFSISGVVTVDECAAGGRLAGLAPVFEATGAAKLAFVGLGRFGTLFLAERRPEREYDPDDWHLLGVVARQAEAALARIEAAGRTV